MSTGSITEILGTFGRFGSSSSSDSSASDSCESPGSAATCSEEVWEAEAPWAGSSPADCFRGRLAFGGESSTSPSLASPVWTTRRPPSAARELDLARLADVLGGEERCSSACATTGEGCAPPLTSADCEGSWVADELAWGWVANATEEELDWAADREGPGSPRPKACCRVEASPPVPNRENRSLVFVCLPKSSEARRRGGGVTARALPLPLPLTSRGDSERLDAGEDDLRRLGCGDSSSACEPSSSGSGDEKRVRFFLSLREGSAEDCEG